MQITRHIYEKSGEAAFMTSMGRADKYSGVLWQQKEAQKPEDCIFH